MAKEVKKAIAKSKKNTSKKKTIEKKPVTKKTTKKPVTKKKTVVKNPQKSYETLLLENFISLQKVMTNLSIKFSELSQNISKMLFVFEEAAKNLSSSEKVMNEQFGKKVENLVEQNKTITKNLSLMDERVRRQGQIKMPTMNHTPLQLKPQTQPKPAPSIISNEVKSSEESKVKTPKSLPQI